MREPGQVRVLDTSYMHLETRLEGRSRRTPRELFAAWAALANIQSEVDTAKSVYGPTRLPRVLEEAKQQCLDDFKLAAGMLHEGQSKAELLRTAEKMVINSLVQQSRKQSAEL